jgi:hypothetical protein
MEATSVFYVVCPSLHATIEELLFSLWSVPEATVVRSPAVTRTISCCEEWVSYELVTWIVPVTSEYSGRAAVFREELQSCRRTDPAILEERQRVKIQCEDSASEL